MKQTSAVAALVLIGLAAGASANARAQVRAQLQAQAQAQVQAPETGVALVQAPGWELVYAHCSACHSLQLVTSQRGDADTWLRLIRWMQATQNLWDLDPETEAGIVGYLAEHYPPRAGARRAPLPKELMPPG